MTLTTEKLINTAGLANKLLHEYGLYDKGWRFELSSTKRIVGQCNFDKKIIVVSMNFMHSDPAEIEDTIRHEIAHALAGPEHGHDSTWRRYAIHVGARPERCAPPEVKSAAKPNYIIECTGCGRRWKRYRLRRSLANEVSICCKTAFKFYRVKK